MTTTARVLTLTDDTFDEVVGAAGVPVLMDVWAAWCRPATCSARSWRRSRRSWPAA